MAGGLNIKMNMLKVLSIISIVIFSGGCTGNKVEVPPFKLLIGGGPGVEFCLMEVKADGILEITSGDINDSNLTHNDNISNITEQRVCF